MSSDFTGTPPTYVWLSCQPWTPFWWLTGLTWAARQLHSMLQFGVLLSTHGMMLGRMIWRWAENIDVRPHAPFVSWWELMTWIKCMRERERELGAIQICHAHNLSLLLPSCLSSRSSAINFIACLHPDLFVSVVFALAHVFWSLSEIQCEFNFFTFTGVKSLHVWCWCCSVWTIQSVDNN